jgi:tetratricopeptide (TPR) repeat protein
VTGHRGVLSGLLLALVIPGAAGLAGQTRPPAPVGAPSLFDAYASGNLDAALTPFRTVAPDRVPAFRQAFLADAAAWIEAVPDERASRVRIAAVLALDAEALLLERGLWSRTDGPPRCAAPCVVEWACAQLRALGEPDPFEALWAEASIALVSGARDWTILVTPLTRPIRDRPTTGHVMHLLERFPDAPRIRLARAVALSARQMVMTEMDAPRDGAPTSHIATPMAGMSADAAAWMDERRRSSLEFATTPLVDLADDPAVGAEARARLAQVHLKLGDFTTARDEALAAADRATEPDVRYLAHVLAAQALQALGNLRAAESQFAAALEARPHSQSASVGLAALRQLRGDGESAYDLVAASLGERPRDDDPWRLFLYGDYPRLPALLARLREAIQP